VVSFRADSSSRAVIAAASVGNRCPDSQLCQLPQRARGAYRGIERHEMPDLRFLSRCRSSQGMGHDVRVWDDCRRDDISGLALKLKV
jgi:hypothetical protein